MSSNHEPTAEELTAVKKIVKQVGSMQGGDMILATGGNGQVEILTEPRVQGKRRYKALIIKRPWMFNVFGDLKDRYKNYPCPCGSDEKIKHCCGIKYL